MRCALAIVLAACGGAPVARAPSERLQVVVSGGEPLAEAAAEEARRALAKMPAGAAAEHFLLEEKVDSAEPVVFLWDPIWHPGALHAAAHRLRRVYADAGYPFATLGWRLVRPNPDLPRGDWAQVEVRFDVRPGARLRLGTVTSEPAAAELVVLRPGEWFSEAKLRLAFRAVRDRLGEEWPMAEIDRGYVQNGDRVDVRAKIANGPAVAFDDPVVVDEKGNDVPVDRGAIDFEAGTPFRRSLVEKAVVELRRAHPEKEVGARWEFTMTTGGKRTLEKLGR